MQSDDALGQADCVLGAMATIIHNGANAGAYFPMYDGNGNVMGYVRGADGVLVSQYEYGPFGELLRSTGPLASAFPHLFSTKYLDWETGLSYYGHRYYSPTPGRWLSRDPLNEAGSLHLYAFCGNDPVNYFDILGLAWYEDLAEWFGTRCAAAKEIMNHSAPPILAATVNPAIDLGYGLVSLPAAIGHLGEGTGEFAGNPSLETAAGMAQDVSLASSVLLAGGGAVAGLRAARPSAAPPASQAPPAPPKTQPPASGQAQPASAPQTAQPTPCNPYEQVAANKALRLPATDTTLAGTRTLGYTTPNGNVFLQPGLSRAEQLSTLRHESVHAFFSPRGSGPVATFRQNLGQWGYDNSQLLRFTEEAIAETCGSGSLLQGLRHPFVNGYGITPGGLLLEGGVVGGGIFGAGYLGSQGGN